MKKYYKKIRYIIEYCIFELFIGLLKIIGFKNSVNFCSYLARVVGPKLKVNNIAKKNIQLVFGNKFDESRVIYQTWDNFGKYIGEFPFIHSLSEKEMKARLKIEDLANINQYKEKKQPVLLFLPHQANWDFVIRHITSIYPKFAIVYRKSNNPYVDRKIFNTRDKDDNILMIAKGPAGAKGLVKAIKGGYSIAMLIDQKMNDGIEVPFFGKPAMTADAIAKLSIQFNYPIIPCQLVRVKNSYFKAILHPALKFKLTKNKEKDTYNIMLKINKYLEKWITQNPGQWFWFHNRWKN